MTSSIIVSLFFLLLPIIARASSNETKSQTSVGGFMDDIAGVGEMVLERLTFRGSHGILAIYPAGGYSPASGFELGIMPVYSWKPRFEGDSNVHLNTVSASMQFSTKGMVQIKSELYWQPHNKWLFKAEAGYSRIVKHFYGLHGATREDINSTFLSEEMLANLQMLRNISPKLHVGSAAIVGSYKLSNWENSSLITGFTGWQGGFVAGLGPLLLFDTRDHIYFPSRGNHLLLGATYFPNWLGGEFDFEHYRVDFRMFAPVNRHVLAFQTRWELANGAQAPFFIMPRLGGVDGLRGIGHPLRVVDRGMALARVEARSPLWWRFGTAFFVEGGYSGNGIWPEPENIIGSFGAGLRFRIFPEEPLNIRIDAGVSTIGTTGFFISLGEAF